MLSFTLSLSLALAGLAHAQDGSSSIAASASAAPVSSASQSLPSQSSSGGPSTSQFKLPLYPPYPISSATITPSASESRSTSAFGSASSAVSSSSPISSYQSDKYWQHTYRDYYASIITVVSTSTLVYKIDCAPNSAHPSYRKPDFQSFDVCAAAVVGRGPMTVTQAPDQWRFAITTVDPAFNLTQTRFNDAATSTLLDITCDALKEKTKTCSNRSGLAPNATSTSAVAAPSLPSGRSISMTFSGDGAAQQYSSEVDALLKNFSTMTEVYVTLTGGFEQLSPSIISSLINQASAVSSPTSSSSVSPSASASKGIAQSASTAGAAARPTGAISLDVMFGAAGLLGAAVFGL